MLQQAMHDLFPKPNHDEAARQEFVNDFRVHLAAKVFPGNFGAYFGRVLPAFAKANGREPKDRHEVRKVMTQDPYYQMWSLMQRSSQEMIWDSVIDTVERTLPDLQAKAKTAKGKGSLTLDPTVEIPRYHTGADIHLQPGAYHTDSVPDDIAQGAVYERGTFIYAMGGMGPQNDGLGRILHKFFRKEWPNRKIGKVVDMGTTIGLGIVYWAQKEPDGEFHAIDVAAPVLRYGHVRAKALGAAVHFSQQNAEKTNFADNSVDLVISHILLHETSRNANQNIFNECHRILKPGGLMLHLDLPQAGAQSPLEGFLWEWEVYNNNEHFYGQLRELDVSEVAAKAGFDKAKFKIHQVDSTWADGQTPYSDSNFTFPVYAAEK